MKKRALLTIKVSYFTALQIDFLVNVW